jgi:hypothetical protein
MVRMVAKKAVKAKNPAEAYEAAVAAIRVFEEVNAKVIDRYKELQDEAEQALASAKDWARREVEGRNASETVQLYRGSFIALEVQVKYGEESYDPKVFRQTLAEQGVKISSDVIRVVKEEVDVHVAKAKGYAGALRAAYVPPKRLTPAVYVKAVVP